MKYTLYEIVSKVKQTLESSMDEPMWLQTEISEINTKGGHCYMEFIQKEEDSNALLARCRATVWASRWRMLSRFFSQSTGQPLSAGMQVLVKVQVNFSEQYGFSLNVIEIDPTYTLGDIARRRRMILQQLEESGIADMNRQLPLPRLLQRIAVISSETAAGWGDFLRQLEDNPYSLRFDVQLFPAIMQGEKVEESIISALDSIASDLDSYDVVVIIRGGGAAADLSGFDTYALAENIAQFPMPVITGIGHERDDTVIDMISCVRVKTPTAAAEYLLTHQLNELMYVNELADRLQNGSLTYISREQNRISLLSQRLSQSPLTMLQQHRHRLELFTARLDGADPNRILRLGYAVVRKQGKAVKKITDIHDTDNIEITVYKGSQEYEVRRINKKS